MLKNTGLLAEDSIIQPLGGRNIPKDRKHTYHHIQWFTVDGLPLESLRALVHARCLVSEVGALFVRALPIPVSNFVTVLTGLRVESSEANQRTLTAELRGVFSNNHQLCEIIFYGGDRVPTWDMEANPPRAYSREEQMAFVWNSLQVTCRQAHPTYVGVRPIWCLWLTPFTSDPTVRRNFTRAVRALAITTSLGPILGNARDADNDLWCQVCQGVDHIKEMCDYPLVPGWVNVDHHPPPPRANNRGGKRGGRGRGRGHN
ncbi:hypothetical protein BKA70DRAFT_1268242 [Coprinopsis sp. MPI-PUGE-AT-0042]|nr:hypothetical protein BKA70DRAFT_1268242 [Coprinopsis sp. MPI-PUGE-AT-0042]